MKISIKEIKVEDDGCELLYIRDFGFVLKSETFSGALKRCKEKGKDELGQEIDFGDIAPLFEQIISRVTSVQHQAQAGEGAPQSKERAAEDKKTG